MAGCRANITEQSIAEVHACAIPSADTKWHILHLAILMLLQTSVKAPLLLVSLLPYDDSDVKLLEDEALHDAAAYWTSRIWRLEHKLCT